MANWRNAVDLGDVFHDESLSFQERRNIIVKRLRVFQHLDLDPGATDTLEDLLDDLADATNEEEFDWTWNDIYDWADCDHRLWIDL